MNQLPKALVDMRLALRYAEREAADTTWVIYFKLVSLAVQGEDSVKQPPRQIGGHGGQG